MKFKYAALLILSFCMLESSGQDKKTKLELMQGIWENIMNSDSEKAYTIIKGMNSLYFVFNSTSNKLNFPLGESIEGFQSIDSGNIDSININSLKDDGMYYTIVDKKYIHANGWIRRPDYLTPTYFECDGELMSINGGQLVEYEKISKLPIDALKKLYYRGKRDNRDYIKDYLGIIVSEIRVTRSRVYSEPNKPTITQLTKGDVVTILEKKGNWLKVDYGEDNRGWVKKEDVK